VPAVTGAGDRVCLGTVSTEISTEKTKGDNIESETGPAEKESTVQQDGHLNVVQQEGTEPAKQAAESAAKQDMEEPAGWDMETGAKQDEESPAEQDVVSAAEQDETLPEQDQERLAEQDKEMSAVRDEETAAEQDTKQALSDGQPVEPVQGAGGHAWAAVGSAGVARWSQDGVWYRASVL
jgi:hypothetical protein